MSALTGIRIRRLTRRAGQVRILPMINRSNRSWVSPVGRAGYAAKGAVYAMVGFLAVKAALGQGGGTTGSKGAIDEIGRQPFGQALLVALAVGLLCYGIWRFLAALADAEGKGADAKGLAARAGYLGSAVVHAGLAFAAAMTALGGSGGGEGTEGWTATLLAAPFGRALVVALGLAVGIAGLMQWGAALSGSYRRKFDLDAAAASQRHWIERASKLGLFARGIVFLIIASFFVRAGLQAQASEAGGLGEALATVQAQPYGPWLLGLVALGVFCYGFYCAIVAIYGHFDTASGHPETSTHRV